jgi:hypothetical protein
MEWVVCFMVLKHLLRPISDVLFNDGLLTYGVGNFCPVWQKGFAGSVLTGNHDDSGSWKILK